LESLSRILQILLELIKAFFAYDYGKTKQQNSDLKENLEVRGDYEDIDNMPISSNDVYAEWMRKDN
jgi:hypothetical protein